MKKIFNKITTGLATFGIAIVSFFSKVFGQFEELGYALYGVPGTEIKVNDTPLYIKNTAKWILIGAAFLVGLINFIKIIKTNDKTQKKKKIKRTIIIIVSILFVALFVVPLIIRGILKINNTY